MQVVKRDGRLVDFDPSKIHNAILAAFKSVDGEISEYAKDKAENIASRRRYLHIYLFTWNDHISRFGNVSQSNIQFNRAFVILIINISVDHNTVINAGFGEELETVFSVMKIHISYSFHIIIDKAGLLHVHNMLFMQWYCLFFAVYQP